jgi:hypothetical protein
VQLEFFSESEAGQFHEVDDFSAEVFDDFISYGQRL